MKLADDYLNIPQVYAQKWQKISQNHRFQSKFIILAHNSQFQHIIYSFSQKPVETPLQFDSETTKKHATLIIIFVYRFIRPKQILQQISASCILLVSCQTVISKQTFILGEHKYKQVKHNICCSFANEQTSRATSSGLNYNLTA